MNLLNITIILFCGIIYTKECTATIDLSNVNLHDFKYFKTKPTNNNYQALSTSFQPIKEALEQTVLEPITDKVQKAKAVAVYFKNVLFGNPDHETEKIIEFNPHFGEAWKPYYEHHYGPNGQYLVESLGNGFDPLSDKLHLDTDDFYHHYHHQNHHYYDHHNYYDNHHYHDNHNYDIVSHYDDDNHHHFDKH